MRQWFTASHSSFILPLVTVVLCSLIENYPFGIVIDDGLNRACHEIDLLFHAAS